MDQSLCWIKFDMKWTYCLAFTFVIVDFLVDKPCTLDDSHRTGTTKVVQAIKSVKENIEDNKEMKIWDQTMYL